MLSKKKSGDRVPEENILDASPRHMTVLTWLKNREFWNAHGNVQVQVSDFVVDRTDGCLYVKLTAFATSNRWVGSNIVLWRIHDGWLRAEYPSDCKFRLDDVKGNKHYRIINTLYKVVKVDDTVHGWWLDD